MTNLISPLPSSTEANPVDPLLQLDAHFQSSSPGITIQVIGKNELATCCFWVALYKPGPTQLRELNYLNSLDEVFQKAASSGINETGPVMLSDTLAQPPRYLYLLPVSKKSWSSHSTNMIADIITAIKAWKAPSIGVYLAPELLQEIGKELSLVELLTEFIDADVVRNFYLYTGSDGFNRTLNRALATKSKFTHSDLNIRIIH
jgi:hypothetical protein